MTDAELSPREVAASLGVTVRTVQRWVAAGRLPARRVGGRVRVSRSSLEAFDPAGKAAEPARAIRTLLIANRGEIAVRIARTARRLGITTVGIHLAGERPPDGMDRTAIVESYLDGPAIVRTALAEAADAIHPGYGFLSENADFARAVANAGLIWVGPPAAAIAAMGDKAAARRHASGQGVPVVPGYDGDAQDDATLEREAGRVGFPLLVKPSGGGGGKGMRVVRAASELREALESARREATRAFGNDRLILERYIEGPRHVEVQILFDAHGHGVHLGERDCSTQRRQQKIVEESPAPSVTPELRERMGAAAVAAARAVGYVNAGTVEFLLADDGSFYFLEMNTRLQVEHPVTEAVTGRDLVADQLAVAQGSELGLPADYQRLTGHAFEARLYAEDPESGFLPATGRLVKLRWPQETRIDTGVQRGDAVSDRFDPLLAKLVVHASTRDAALARLRRALDETIVLGVRTNLRFLRWLLAEPVMTDGEMRTDTLSRIELPKAPSIPADAWRLAARALSAEEVGVWAGGWRLNAEPQLRVRHGEEERAVGLPAGGSTAVGEVATDPDSGEVFVDVEGQSLEFELAAAPSVDDAARQATAGGSGEARLTAPMPGRVISVRVAEGGSVKEQQPVIIIEAMKMEHGVVSPLTGRVTRIATREGAQVQRGDILAEVKAES
jgi:acetyl-CoA/propionyl-CoA carboxylase biotin carboxyl carrier protein